MTDPKQFSEERQSLIDTAQLEKLRLENEKLRIDIENLRKGKGLSVFTPYLPLITVLVTVAGFGFGIYQYQVQQKANREAQAKQSDKDRETREIQSKKDTEAAQQEFMKPLLQNQLTLYLQASNAAATIATSNDSAERSKAVNDFWRLYEGPLIMVESKEVSGAMVAFGQCLTDSGNCGKGELINRSRAIASRMQESLLKSWNTNPENFMTDKFSYR